MKRINVGMIGAGTVGGGVYASLRRNGALLASRLGLRIAVTRVAVRSLRRSREVPIPERLLTTHWREVVDDPRIHVIAEVMGGTSIARDVVLAALRARKPVVTANKALLSAHGEEIFETAAANGVNIYFEAGVAGGIPIIKVLREGLIGNRISSIFGILNGTCNYILTRMNADREEFAPVLRRAQELGFAEADPALDVDGYDAQHKAGILASLAFDSWIRPEWIHVEGIRGVTAMDHDFARLLGYTIKLLAIIRRTHDRRGTGPTVQVSVYPALIPSSHVLASVQDEFNAVFVKGDIVDDTLYYGRGAGRDATASAVLSDLADAALDLKYGSSHRLHPGIADRSDLSVTPLDELSCRSYLRLTVTDEPGSLAQIASVFAKRNIGISSVIQPEGHAGDRVPLILMLHEAKNRAIREALDRVARLPVVQAPPYLIRVDDLRDS